MEAGGLEHHVFAAAGLDRLKQLVGVLQRPENRRHCRGDVLAVLEDLDAVPRVAGGVGGHEHRLDAVVLDQLLERGIGLGAPAGLGQSRAAVGNQVAHGHHLDIRVVLEPELGAELAHPVAGDPDANLAVGDGLPAFRGLGSSGARSNPWIGFSCEKADDWNPRAAAPSPMLCMNARRVSEAPAPWPLEAAAHKLAEVMSPAWPRPRPCQDSTLSGLFSLANCNDIARRSRTNLLALRGAGEHKGGMFMRHFLRIEVTAMFLSAALSAAAAAENPFLGGWALTLPGGAPGWLGVEEAGGGLKASLLWGWGSVEADRIRQGGGWQADRDAHAQTSGAARAASEVRKTLVETITATVDGDAPNSPPSRRARTAKARTRLASLADGSRRCRRRQTWPGEVRRPDPALQRQGPRRLAAHRPATRSTAGA